MKTVRQIFDIIHGFSGQIGAICKVFTSLYIADGFLRCALESLKENGLEDRIPERLYNHAPTRIIARTRRKVPAPTQDGGNY